MATSGALVAIEATPASAYTACSYAMCGYDGTGYTGAMLPFAKYMCGYYHNLGEQGFNDRLSSLDNWAAYTQYFWKDADQKGAELSLAPYGMYSNLSNQGFNNLISSVLWTG